MRVHALSFRILPYALLIAAVFAAYANIYGNLFLYDDEILIVHNPALTGWGAFLSSVMTPLSFDSSYYRPLQTFLYTIVFQLAGLSLFSFHLLNVTLHALNAALVYRLGQKLNFKPVASFLAALLWAVHPLQTEAVTYMSATADTLYAFFCLLGAVVLLPDFTPRRIAAAALLMLLGLFSKESACVFPLLAACCLYLQSDKRFEAKTYIRLWPLVVVVLAYVGLRFALMPPHVAGAANGVPTSFSGGVDYAPFAALPVYLKLILWPTHLHMEYDLPVYGNIRHAVVLGGMGMILLSVTQVLCFSRPRNLPLNWGLCWFAAAYLPCIFVEGLFYEHWMYLPLAGLFLGIAQTAALYIQKIGAAKRKSVYSTATTISLLAAAVMGILTYQQNEIWREPVAFYTHIFEQGELAVKPHVNLGVIYAERGDYEKAIAQYQIAIKNSHDTQAMAQANLAAALLMLPDRDQHAEEAVAHFQRALEIDPRLYPALEALAAFYDQQGNPAKAAFYRDQADKIRNK
ncbi:MAG: hypothetical protein WCD70_08500 [Alphaproteobacteria bacterium]